MFQHYYVLGQQNHPITVICSYLKQTQNILNIKPWKHSLWLGLHHQFWIILVNRKTVHECPRKSKCYAIICKTNTPFEVRNMQTVTGDLTNWTFDSSIKRFFTLRQTFKRALPNNNYKYLILHVCKVSSGQVLLYSFLSSIVRSISQSSLRELLLDLWNHEFYKSKCFLAKCVPSI